MQLYVCQVKTGDEKKVISQICKQTGPLITASFHVPERELSIRRAGKFRKEKSLLFPSYIFLEAEELQVDLIQLCRKITGFFRFLPDNNNPTPLSPEEREILKHLINGGRVLGHSQVIFHENGRIQVTSGPLQGLEGSIVKVNRRKRRIRIRLDLYKNSHLIDLGFEEVTPQDSKDSETTGSGTS